jgi:histone H3/H4
VVTENFLPFYPFSRLVHKIARDERKEAQTVYRFQWVTLDTLQDVAEKFIVDMFESKFCHFDDITLTDFY